MRQAGRGAAAEEGGGVGYKGKRKGWIERRGERSVRRGDREERRFFLVRGLGKDDEKKPAKKPGRK